MTIVVGSIKSYPVLPSGDHETRGGKDARPEGRADRL